jgi:hypothetical protein
MQTAIGYLRVSTAEQGRSGLGPAAQRFDIKSSGTHCRITCMRDCQPPDAAHTDRMPVHIAR